MKKVTKYVTMLLVLIFMTFLPIKLMFPRGYIVQAAVGSETYSVWNSTTIYNNGDIVSYNGSLWMAQCWIQRLIPLNTGEWGVWKMYKSDIGTTKGAMSKKLIALTFDDGPSETTTLVLDKLQKYNAVASFFLVGNNVTDTTKSIMQRELSLGCEINSHAWSHSYMNEMSSVDIIYEMQRTSDAIYKMVGVRPKFFRPPYIATSNTLYKAIDIPFICGIGCGDWDSSVSIQSRVATVLNEAKDGDIILLHDLLGNIQTVDALDAIIQGLRDKGFTFVTVSQLFEQKGVNPNVEDKLWTNAMN